MSSRESLLVKKTGAIVYVLPETGTPQQLFGSWDVTGPSQAAQVVAARQPAPTDAGGAKDAKRNRDAVQ